MSQLDELKKYTVVVADTGDIDAIKQFSPEDATTNPSLILKAAQLPQYQYLINTAIAEAKSLGGDKKTQLAHASDRVAVNIGTEILRYIPGRISTEVDARLSFDRDLCIDKARTLIKLYAQKGVPRSRVLIKLAATWEGIQAARILEREDIHCNLTLLFSFAQARACAEAAVFLISPFVGRILDWCKNKEPSATFSAATDPGVISVKKIYDFYKQHGYQTIVMGASFRNKEEILALAGCDRLTITPTFLAELVRSNAKVTRKLIPADKIEPAPCPLSEAEFRWLHNNDAMAVDKLAEGIRLFAADQAKLEDRLDTLL